MKTPGCLLLISLSTTSFAAEKIPLNTFLNDIRDQLVAIEQPERKDPKRAGIRNVHIELNVVVEKDAQGRPRYYVLDGIVDNRDVITQRISFDMELHHKSTAAADRQAKRVYSTRRRDYRYGDDRYYPAGRYPSHPGYYIPDIYPVILFEKDH